MASGDDKLSTEDRVRGSVRRTLTNLVVVLVVLGVVGVWGSFGAFTLKPGEAAVLLLFGKHYRTITQDGFHLSIPPPLVERFILTFEKEQLQDFGFSGPEGSGTSSEDLMEATMQTSGNNIVRLSFALQYKIKDPFLARFRLAEPEPVLRDAAQAAMREVVGRMEVDGVLREQRGLVASEAERLLQEILDSYDSGIVVTGTQLQNVQPPGPVRASFDDVVRAIQDGSRLVNEAEGYRNEVIPQAQAQAAEMRAEAGAYRDSKIAEATGEANRFAAIAVEWRKAPEVTRKRLYLETMEVVLPEVDKVIIEPGTTQVLPYLPLGQDRAPAGAQPAAAASASPAAARPTSAPPGSPSSTAEDGEEVPAANPTPATGAATP
jgi:membrane protease subunit HflK